MIMSASSGSAVCCGGSGPVVSCGGGGKIMTTLVSLSSLLILFVILSVSAQDFRVGQKEVVVMSGRSLYWPYSLTGDNSNGNHHHLATEKRNAQPIQLCGYRLLEAVRGLCRGNYVGFSRRSDPDMEDDEHMMGDSSVTNDQEITANPSPLRHRHHKRQKSHLRFRRNIIDECCMKPCSVNVMLRYCGRK